jgi:hypothetical protein
MTSSFDATVAPKLEERFDPSVRLRVVVITENLN